MSTAIFNLARKFKISRFTIDVLMQRLADLKPPRHRAPEECDRFVGHAHEIVTACDRLHNQLRDQFARVQASDVGTLSSLSAGIEELHHKITESIATVNSFEFGTAR
jgi:hypothetical protein